ncbi:hypothetical protein [Oerskovia paurometabola]|uniref:hypothetical protein n=1 Tax=Oerskovia paurometabola TaxID=162170 RepID=UPI00381336FB
MSDLTLEDQMEALIVDAYVAAMGREPKPQWLHALSMRFGTAGVVSTLDEAGSAVGVTRERVRQVTAKVAPHLKGAEVPGLALVAAHLAHHSPVAEPIGRSLFQSGLTRPTLTGGAFLNFVELVGTTTQDLAGVELVRLDDWLVDAVELPVLAAFSTASRHTSKYGMTTVEEIRQTLATPDNPLDPGDIERVLRAEPLVRWHAGWLWVEKELDSVYSSRLINTARSVLSVNSPLTVASIHEGCRRVWKFRGLDILPSVEAMRGFFEASAYFDVDDDLVRPLEPLDYHEVLGDVSSTMVDVLKSSTYQVMDRQTLHEACDDAGIAKGTYGIWTTYAEWMERFGPNVWGLRGSAPSPAAVTAIREAARARSKAESRRKSWAWMVDGGIVHTMDATTSFLSTGVMSFAPDVHRLLAAQSAKVFVEDQAVATAKFGDDHSFCWGWSPALRAVGAKRGDVLQIRLNVAEHTAELRRGGREFWD